MRLVTSPVAIPATGHTSNALKLTRAALKTTTTTKFTCHNNNNNNIRRVKYFNM